MHEPLAVFGFGVKWPQQAPSPKIPGQQDGGTEPRYFLERGAEPVWVAASVVVSRAARPMGYIVALLRNIAVPYRAYSGALYEQIAAGPRRKLDAPAAGRLACKPWRRRAVRRSNGTPFRLARSRSCAQFRSTPIGGILSDRAAAAGQAAAAPYSGAAGTSLPSRRQ
jgi:hypothetical protein